MSFSSGLSQGTKPGRQLLLVACFSDLDKEKMNSITCKNNKSFCKNLKSLCEVGER